MGGSNNNFFDKNRSPESVAKKLHEEAQISAAEFDTTLAQMLNDLLVGYNNRNSDDIRQRLDDIKTALANKFLSSIDTLFGGSVAKHTYVDGLSDVDSLLIFEDEQGLTPDKLLIKIEDILSEALDATTVQHGNIAITVEYKDGPEIQLIPAVNNGGTIKIPDFENNAWAAIYPTRFSELLTDSNNKCSGKLVPTIKLAKAINATLPKQLQLTGYHMEALGIMAFNDYDGAKTTSSMLPHFFQKASEIVLEPITDKTGQSVHIDDYLGEASSEQRQMLSHTLKRLYTRMLNASASGSKERWMELFGE